VRQTCHEPPLLLSGSQRAEHPDAAPVNFKKAQKEATGQQPQLF
jgi:hypothetical protein